MQWRAIDLETGLIAPGCIAPRPVSIAWADVQSPESVTLRLWSDPCVLRELGEVLTGGVVGHNVAFDMGVLVQWYPSLRPAIWKAYAEGRVLDTMLECRLLDVAEDNVQKEYHLANCCKRFLDVDVKGKHGPDAWRLRYEELRDVPVALWPEAAVQYARLDVTYTALLFAKVGRQPTDDFESRPAWILHLSRAWGVRSDPLAVPALEHKLAEVLQERDAVLRQHGILRRDGSKDTKAIKMLVRAELGEDAPKTDTGEVKTDVETLRLCTHPALVAMAEAGAASTLQSTFLPVVQQGVSKPIHPEYVSIVRSGRVSCQKPNLQNIPRKGGVRECFVPRPGNVFISVDYAGAELVCLAQVLLHLFGESAMANAIRSGFDLHLNTASMLLGRSYEDTVKAYKVGEKEAVETRQLSKALNFGIPGGLSAKTLRVYLRGYGINVSLPEATDYRNRWLLLYPEMELYFKLLKNASRAGAFRIRHPLTGFVRGGCQYTSGANHYFQHLLAKVAKEALWRVGVECYGALGSRTALTGTRVVLFIHDEVILEAPAATAPEAAERLAEVMYEASKVWMPDLPLKSEPALMERWFKQAKTVRDANGRLKVWTP